MKKKKKRENESEKFIEKKGTEYKPNVRNILYKNKRKMGE